MRRIRESLIGGAVLVAAVCSSGSAWGQDLRPLEEIVVTAAKREQTLQEIPVAVTVISADVMQKAQIIDIKDLQSLVPALRVSQLQLAGNTSFFIRGFGNGSNNIGTEPSVGVFIDGVYRSRTASALADYPSLERIEVLRGPQSTLFGKNASAGVISVVTAKPDLDAYGGSAAVTFGEFDQIIVKGEVTGPLSDKVAFSLSANSNNRNGYFTNLTNGEKINEIDRYGVRGQLLFLPTDNLEFRLIVDSDRSEEFCCGTVNILDGPSSGIIALIGGQVFTGDPFARSQFLSHNPRNKIESDGVSLQVDYDFENVTLTSITSSRTLKRNEDGDGDFTSAELLGENSSDNDIDSFTQELRLTSSGDGAFDWMVGGFFFDETVDINNTLSFGQDFRSFFDIVTGGFPPAGIPSGLDNTEDSFGLPRGSFQQPGTGFVEVMSQDNQAFSIFGQVDLYINDRFTLTLGANYTEDEKDVGINIQSNALFSSLDFEQIVYSQFFAGITGLPPTQANIDANPVADGIAIQFARTGCTATTAPNCNPLIPLMSLQFLPPFANFPNAVENGSTRDTDTTWTARLAFDATDRVNIYFGAATGFKASSWNLTRDSRPFPSDLAGLGAGPNDRFGPPNLVSGTRFAGPEDAIAFEIGLKARFDRGSINVAIFDQEIEGFQSSVFIGTGFVLANAGKQSTTGLEFEANYEPTDSWQLAFSGAFMDPKYDSFVGASGPTGPVDLSGQSVAGVSEVSLNFSATYNFEVGASASGFVRGAYVFDSEVQVVENIPESILAREVSTFNGSIGVEWDNGLQVLLWGRNITDDEYLTSGFPTTVQTDRVSAYPNQPRTFGLTVSKYFD